jgi:hypothetical protein
MNRGEELETLEAKAPLTELHATASPSIASTAAWISRARIGSPWPSKTWTRAPTTQPGRRDRRRWLGTTRGSAPLARTAASFSVNRANDPRRSWFDRTPIRSTARESNVHRTISVSTHLRRVAPVKNMPRRFATAEHPCQLGVTAGRKQRQSKPTSAPTRRGAPASGRRRPAR